MGLGIPHLRTRGVQVRKTEKPGKCKISHKAGFSTSLFKAGRYTQYFFSEWRCTYQFPIFNSQLLTKGSVWKKESLIIL